MFKVTEFERKVRDINLFIDMQINLSSCRTSDHYFLLTLHQLSWYFLGNKNLSSTHGQNFWNFWKQIMAAKKMW